MKKIFFTLVPCLITYSSGLKVCISKNFMTSSLISEKSGLSAIMWLCSCYMMDDFIEGERRSRKWLSSFCYNRESWLVMRYSLTFSCSSWGISRYWSVVLALVSFDSYSDAFMFNYEASTANSPNMFALIRAPQKSPPEQNIIWVVPRGPISLPVRSITAAWRTVKY